MKLQIIILSLFLLNVACVLPPDVATVDTTVGVGVEPRVHFGSRSSVVIWLPPRIQVRNAYDMAAAHCRRWGLWANPSYDWPVTSLRSRRLRYSCVSRPVIGGVPVYRRPYVAPRRPRANWWRRKHVYTPAPVVVPRRRTLEPSRPVVVPRPPKVQVREYKKPYEHNLNKKKIVKRRVFGSGEITSTGPKPWSSRGVKKKIFGSSRFGGSSLSTGPTKKRSTLAL